MHFSCMLCKLFISWEYLKDTVHCIAPFMVFLQVYFQVNNAFNSWGSNNKCTYSKTHRYQTCFHFKTDLQNRVLIWCAGGGGHPRNMLFTLFTFCTPSIENPSGWTVQGSSGGYRLAVALDGVHSRTAGIQLDNAEQRAYRSGILPSPAVSVWMVQKVGSYNSHCSPAVSVWMVQKVGSYNSHCERTVSDRRRAGPTEMSMVWNKRKFKSIGPH